MEPTSRRLARDLAYAALFILLQPPLPVSGGDLSLEAAWQEYEFQSFKQAARCFDRITETMPDAATLREARLGQAMTAHFRENSRDLKEAKRTYQMLEEADGSDAVGLMARSMRAELLAEEGGLDEANRIWDALITGHPETLVAQDALLRRTVANLGPITSDRTREALQYLERQRRGFPAPTPERPGLAPVMDAFAADVYLWRGEYRNARDACMRSAEIRTVKTTSYHSVANTHMRIARLSEKVLNDPETAGRYYRRLLFETPNDPRVYFALEKAVALDSVTRAEVEAMDLQGFTAELLDALFDKENP